MARESIDTVSEVVYHTHETSDCFQGSGLWNLPDPLNPLVTQLHSFFAKNVAKELNMIHAKVALGWFEPDVEFH